MARWTILVVDRQQIRRKDLARGLGSYGYEVVTAADGDEGKRFAEGLSPDAVVVEADLAGPVLAAADGEAGPLRIVLDDAEEAATAGPGPVVAVAGLAPEAIVRKVRTALLGRELGIPADARLEALEGNLLALPLLELLPKLRRLVVSGRVLLGDGEVALEEGEAVAARAGSVRGAKAFARLARTTFGSFRVLLGPNGGPREIAEDMLSLMALAMEDQARFTEACGRLPDLASRLRLVIGPAFFATQFTPGQQGVLAGAHDGGTIGDVVDGASEPDGVVLGAIADLHEIGLVAFDEPEIKVRVVTDSTADLPPDVAEKNRIHVVPLSVLFGKEFYKDGIDLRPAAFYELLQDHKRGHPQTSPPTKGEFLAAYRQVVGRSDVVSVHISEKMSKTAAHARAAVKEGSDEFRTLRGDGTPAMEVVDSLQVSSGLALLAVIAARLAMRRLEASEIRARIEAMRPRIHLLFVVDTLEYLARGGRIGQAQAWFGGLLGIKPILGVVNGEVVPVDRVRGGANAQARLVALLKERVDAARPVIVGIAHAAAPEWAARLSGLLHGAFEIAELLESEIGPVVGTHVGPGCVGAAVFQPTEDELALVAPPA
ncbi:MAG TPA: DegV family protein [Thermoanaerobaculaceae bacterium]|nr:DegV family protein [Thermoanaerobaculaceae bacterium]